MSDEDKNPSQGEVLEKSQSIPKITEVDPGGSEPTDAQGVPKITPVTPSQEPGGGNDEGGSSGDGSGSGSGGSGTGDEGGDT